MMVQVGGNTVSVQVQSSGLGAALALSLSMAAEVAEAEAAATAAAASQTAAQASQAAAASSAAAAAATLAGAALKAANLSDMTDGDAAFANLDFLQSGTGAVARSARAKAREVVSVTDFLAADHDFETDDATYAFEAAQTALGAYGGDILVPAVGDYRINFTINKSNVRLVGRGGVGELSGSDVGAGSRFPALRPFNTGADTFVVRVSDGFSVSRRVKLDRLSICGDDGDGNQAEYALLLCGGCVNIQLDVDLSEGQKTLAVDPQATVDTADPDWPGYPIYGVDGVASIRNDVLADANSRALYIRKYADVDGYVTAFNLSTKMNRPPAAIGYAIELDGTGSTGLAVHLNGYLDCAPGYGILMHGFEVLVCTDLQIDPGAPGTVVIKRLDNTKDISRFVQGFIEGYGGQLVEFLDTTTWTLPSEPGPVLYEPRIRRAFMGSETYWTASDSNPYDTSVLTDFTGVGGYMRWNGIKTRWTNTTDVSGDNASAIFDGGMIVEKNIRVDSGSVTVGTTSYDSGRMDAPSNHRIVIGGTLLIGAAGSVAPDSTQPNCTIGKAGDPFARSYFTQMTVGSSATTSPSVFSGSGTPESVVTAPVGSLYLRTDGGAGTSVYVKETGTSNTGWVGK